MIKENSDFRIYWDSLSVILIIASCFLIPFQLAFQHVVLKGGTTLLFVINIFFIIDIILNFITSHRHQGIEIIDRKKTATRYLKTFFAFDLIANFPFDALTLGIQDVQFYNISLVIFFRLFRLLRIVRLFVIFHRWEGMSRTNSGFLRISKFFLITIVLIHWIACAWFLFAFLADFPASCWVVRSGITGATPGAQYIRSLYWTITTMTTVGYGDITPVLPVEYIIAMIVMLSGASMYAFIIGRIASLFSNIDSAKVGHWNRIEAITQFLRYRQVPQKLNTRVRNYYEYIWAHHRGIKPGEFFNDLPGPLKFEILLHLTKELRETVPLFKYATPTLRDILVKALDPQTFAPEDLIVQEGDIGEEIYFISQGKAEILSDAGRKNHGVLEKGDYFGYMSFILREKRTASVKAISYCEIFVLTSDAFNRIMTSHPELRSVLKKLSSEKTDKIAALVLEGIIL